MRQCTINGITIGREAPVRVMGVINCSPESFYADSFIPTKEVHAKAVEMVEAGAHILDLGARSTAPNTQAISGTQEAERIDEALKELDGTGFTISVDTMNPWVLDVCMKHEIHAVNDIAGFCSPAYVKRVADAGMPAIVMATNYQPGDAVGVGATHKALATVMQRCESAGIDNYVLDPGIGLWTPLRSVDDDWELSRHFDEFLRYDHPLLAAVIDLTLERHRDLLKRGAVLVDEKDHSEQLRALVYLEHSIQDARTDRSGQRRRTANAVDHGIVLQLDRRAHRLLPLRSILHACACTFKLRATRAGPEPRARSQEPTNVSVPMLRSAATRMPKESR